MNRAIDAMKREADAVGALMPEEAAERLGIPRARFSDWARTGVIPGAFRLHEIRGPMGAWLIRPADIDAFLANGGEPSPPSSNGDHPDEERLVTTSELARRLGVSQATIQRKFHDGSLPVGTRRENGRGGSHFVVTEADAQRLEAIGREGLGIQFRASMPTPQPSGVSPTPPPPPSPPGDDALALAEQLRATADRLIRVLKRDQDQKTRVANELVKLLDPARSER